MKASKTSSGEDGRYSFPLLTEVASLTDQINQYDALIVDLADSKYPETVVICVELAA